MRQGLGIATMSSTTTRELQGADWVAPDCAGMNFYDCDPGLQHGVSLYLPEDLRAVVEPRVNATRPSTLRKWRPSDS